MKAAALANLDNHEEAVRIFDQLLEKEPENAAAWIQKGVSISALSDENNSREDDYHQCFSKALQLKNNSVETLFEIGQALFTTNQIKQAVDYFDKAVEADPRFKDAYVNRVRVHRNRLPF
jgi:tetratricopeptide (TPR) repeat protein